MLKSMQISNFQSHKQSKLEFADGVNVIIGASDSGKTTIIRALRWLIWNRPTGEAFRSNWGGSTSVEIVIDNQNILRIKDQADNEYALGKQIFKAFKTEVPEEIIQALNINEINLQNQLDSPFLLSNSPGEVAQHFNRIAHLEQINKGISNVKKWIAKIESDIEYQSEELKKANENLLKYSHLSMFEEDVEVLEEMQSQLITKVNNKNKLIQLTSSLQDVSKQIEQESEIIQAEKTLDNVLKCIVDRNDKQHEKGLLNRLIHDAKQVMEDLQEQEKILIAEKPVIQLLDLFEEKSEKEGDLERLQMLIDHINNNIIYKQEGEVQMERFTKEFNEAFPNICPLCGQKVKK